MSDEKDLNITETFGKAEAYIERNKKLLTIIVSAVVVVIGGYLGYKQFVIKPQEIEAEAQMFVAERYFEQDSLKLAINGDGNYMGFEAIVNDYSGTPSANLAKYYLGICYLRSGKFQEAIDMLESYSAGDEMTGIMAVGAIGDANSELGKYPEAADKYMEAANEKNNFTSPIYFMKASVVYEKLGDYAKAIEVYEKIQKEYPSSTEGREIEKYISRAKTFLKS